MSTDSLPVAHQALSTLVDLVLEARGLAELMGDHRQPPAWAHPVAMLLYRLVDGIDAMELAFHAQGEASS